jgi:nucleoside-diphosphate-sugar epimerase
MARTALVIGGRGFLGSAITTHLVEAAWSVTTLGRRAPAEPAGRVTHAVLDRTDAAAMQAFVRDRRFDLVVDCAAYKPDDARGAVEQLAGRCGRFVFISTDFVYRAVDGLSLPIDEQSPTQVDHPYGVGKLACEAVFREAFERSGFPVQTLRPPHILGAGKNLGCDFLAMRDPEVLAKLRDGRTELTAEGQLLVQPVWTREIARCAAHLADVPATGEVFNLAGPDCVTTKRYYQLIAERLGVALAFRSVSMEELARRKPDVMPVARHRIYDTTRLTRVTGYRPSLRLADAIDETLAWMRSREQAV